MAYKEFAVEKGIGKAFGGKIEKNPKVAENIACEGSIVSRNSDGR